jgi:hypothetical protein
MNASVVAIEGKREYPWYATVTGQSLCQGDILINFDVIVPDSSGEGDSAPARVLTIDALVMTQTCDIEHGKVDSLLLCPCWDLWTFVERANKNGENWGNDQRNALRLGNLPGYYLANDANQDGIVLGLTIVDFHEIYTAPKRLIMNFAAAAGNRLRMLPPYREHLAQAFARFFMRVGLPIDIPESKIKSRHH